MNSSLKLQAPEQPDLFKAETQWFHMFRAMIANGDLARLSGSSIKVYLVIKSHANYSTGSSFPSIQTIAREAGLSVAQVNRELKVLEEQGYILRKKIRRNNTYTLKEKVGIRNNDGNQAATASWPYIPQQVQKNVDKLKKFVATGDFNVENIIQIENLQININNLQDNSANLSIQNLNLDSLPVEIKELLISAIEASRLRKKD